MEFAALEALHKQLKAKYPEVAEMPLSADHSAILDALLAGSYSDGTAEIRLAVEKLKITGTEVAPETVSDDVCAICREPVGNFITRCGHQFHEECLSEWIKQHAKFPTCRGPVGAVEVVESLLRKHEFDTGDWDKGPLKVALVEIFKQSAPLSASFLKTFEQTLTLDIDLSSTDSSGSTALHYACSSSHLQAVQRLIQHKANLNATESYG